MEYKSFYDYKRFVAIDSETSNGQGSGSLDPRTGFLALIQLKIDDGPIQLLRPNNKEHLDYVKRLVSDPDTLCIFHNAKFDYKFFIQLGIVPHNIFDTFIASELIYAGIMRPDEATKKTLKTEKLFKKNSEDEEELFSDIEDLLIYKEKKSSEMSHKLQTCLLRELGIFISKDAQNSDWTKEPLSNDQIVYAENDVRNLLDLAKALWKKLEDKGLEKVAMAIEMPFIKVLANMEFVGLKIDRDAWKERHSALAIELENQRKTLEEEIGIYVNSQNTNSEKQPLFENVLPSINLNSAVQMPKILGLPNIQAMTLLKNKNKHPFISKYIDYKKLKREVSTYGEGYLKHVDTNNRLHGNFTQTKTATGRLSSRAPNLQNVGPFFKEVVRSEAGYIPVIADFSQVELRIIAYASKDPNFIEATNSNDIHSITARRMYGIPEDEKPSTELRKKAKGYTFGIAYGLSPKGAIARDLAKDIETAKDDIDRFYSAYEDVKTYLHSQGPFAIRHGYISNETGRRRTFVIPKRPRDYDLKRKIIWDWKLILKNIGVELYDLVEYENFNDIKNRNKDLTKKILSVNMADEDIDILREVSSYEKELASIAREAQNAPIQSLSADITKKAMIDLYEYFVETGYGVITLTIHDSILFEVREDYFHVAYPKILEIMEQAGPKVFAPIKTPVDADVGWQTHFKCVDCGADVKAYTLKVTEDYKPVLRDPKNVYCETCKKNH